MKLLNRDHPAGHLASCSSANLRHRKRLLPPIQPERSLVLWLRNFMGNSVHSLHLGRHWRRLHSGHQRVAGTAGLWQPITGRVAQRHKQADLRLDVLHSHLIPWRGSWTEL